MQRMPALLLLWLPCLLFETARAQCPEEMPSACECHGNKTAQWTCVGDFDLSKVIFRAAQNNVDKLVLRNCKQPMLTLGVLHPLGLRRLEISSCGIRHVHKLAFDQLKEHLEEIILQNNSITEMPALQNLTKLRSLNLNGNKISAVPEGAFKSTGLRLLRLERNDICELSINALAETSQSLELLDLSENCLTAVPAANLRPLRRLMYLDLSGNQIAELPPLTFHALPELAEVRLMKNQLVRIPANAFSSLPKLEAIFLRANRLTVIEDSAFQGAKQLQKLDLIQNQLSKMPSLGGLEKLTSLRLDRNRIDRIEADAFRDQPNLEFASLAENRITSLAPGSFTGLEHLRVLVLSDNVIKTIDSNTLKGLPELAKLILRNNSIVDIDKAAFMATPLLLSLDLSRNRLQKVKTDTFTKLANLTQLDLSHNELSTLDEGTFSTQKTPQLRFLFLNDNPLICDVKFDWFLTYISVHNAQLKTSTSAGEDATCAAPEKYASLPLRTVVVRKADERLTDSLQSLGLSRGGSTFLKTPQQNNWINSFLPALTGQPAAVGNTQNLAFLSSLLKAVPQEWRTQLKDIPGLNMLRSGDGLLPEDKAFDEVLEQLSEPLVRAAKGVGMTQEDLNQLLRSIPELAKKLPRDASLANLEDVFVNTVFDGNGINDPSTKEKLNAVGQRYAQQLSAAAAKAMGMPFNETMLGNSIDSARMLDKMRVLPERFIDGVLQGKPIPFLTTEETQAVKDYLTKRFVETKSNLNVTELLGSPEMMKLAKLLPPGTNLTQIPKQVLEDIKTAVKNGKLPSIETILNLPPDIVESMRRKVEELTAVEEEEVVLPDSFDLPPLEEHERTTTTPPYDINRVDSDLVIREKDNTTRTWVILGTILGALAIFGVAMAAYLAWHYSQSSYKVCDPVETRRGNSDRSTNDVTIPRGFRPKFTSTLKEDGLAAMISPPTNPSSGIDLS